MNKLIIILISSLTLLVSNKSAMSDTTVVPYHIYNASNAFKIDVALLYAICQVESNCKAKAINHDDGNSAQKAKGIIDKSYGLFQIKVSTAKGLGFVDRETVTIDKVIRGKVKKVKVTIDHVKDLLDPEINSWYAAKLLRQLYKRYGNNTNKVISAYNAGRYTTANKGYVFKVLKNYTKYKIDKRF